MRVKCIHTNKEVFEVARYIKTYNYLVCIGRGPFIYTLEAIDNNISEVSVIEH